MKVRGIGIGSMVYGVGYGFSRPDFASAEVEIAPDGTVTIWSGASELGQGIRTVLSQIVAQEFGAAYEDIRVISADTDKTPDSGPVSASRSTYVQGNAVLAACKDLKQELISLASELMGVESNLVEIQNGQIAAKDKIGKIISFSKLASEMHVQGRRTHGFGWHNNRTLDVDKNTSQGDAYSSYAWASQLVEVEVDTQTGRVKILRLASATDVGKAINPQLIEGQIEGGAVQGLGFALMEEMQVEQGVFNNANLSTYLIPTAADVPPIDSLIVEVSDPSGPYGAKGMAEPATIPTTPAILNAIADAISKRVRYSLASPENVLKVLGKIDGSGKEGFLLLEDIPYPVA
ncbi:MAG: nicotinate dehydrogenase medium molybdopterin subunit [Chloroflexi bacterium HGW-Chloroflexi-3]|nr:MAG: nicotinate dehydrogenase medium molybdopterin subunit [Chloroflexi bacterium HGW-Chloroflexi-3]